jgi:hypothetical protein
MATTYTLISSVTVGSGGAANITFSSIPATYTDLLVKLSIRTVQTDTFDLIKMYFNGTESNVSMRELYGTGSAAASGSQSQNRLGYVSGNSSTSNTFGSSELYIPNYASSNNKSSSADSVSENNATTAIAGITANLWSSSSAITSITFYSQNGNVMQYSTAYLYGISNA